MNIIQAIKSGKRFKRKYHSDWMQAEVCRDLSISAIDILEDDWHTEEKSVEVTATMVRQAVAKLHGRYIGSLDETADFIIKELGL